MTTGSYLLTLANLSFPPFPSSASDGKCTQMFRLDPWLHPLISSSKALQLSCPQTQPGPLLADIQPWLTSSTAPTLVLTLVLSHLDCSKPPVAHLASSCLILCTEARANPLICQITALVGSNSPGLPITPRVRSRSKLGPVL